ncbi:MAG: hypothetical protein KY455_02515 [Euryarchaeota archaeon]|nr:hypothetical protein [Euryarchaeota archaeon]
MGRPLLLALLFILPLLSGCTSEGLPGERAVTDHTWRAGDTWTYLRTHDDGPPFIYTREVTGLFNKDGYEVFELTEGMSGHTIRQRSLYTVDDLRFFGFEVRDGDEPRQTLAPTRPIPFHYVFPLEPGTAQTFEGIVEQSAGDHRQSERVHVTATVKTATKQVLGERVYTVWPYEMRIDWLDTPFDDGATIRGHWAPTVGQSVLTEVEQGGQTTRYEIVSFQRRLPVAGPPAYALTEGLRSQALDRGFLARIDGPGYARWLLHVEVPTTVGVRFDHPTAPSDGRHRFDLVSLRPLGATGAWVFRDPTALSGHGFAFHMWAGEAGKPGHEFHSPAGAGERPVTLQPGQVYELVVASNHGGTQANLRVGDEARDRAPAQTGSVDILRIAHRRVTEETSPGPQLVRDHETHLVSLPEGERIEGLVFALNHGGEEATVAETAGRRTVSFGVHDLLIEDPGSVYGVYMSHPARSAFEVSVGYEYRADLALQGAVDYELGVFLMRLVADDEKKD